MKKTMFVLMLASLPVSVTTAEPTIDQDIFTQLSIYDAYDFIVDEIVDKGERLHVAASKGDLALVQQLVSQGAWVDYTSQQTASRHTPLIAAVAGGHLPVVMYLLDAGADINHVSRASGTALDMALVTGKREIAFMLRERGAILSTPVP